MSTVLLSPAVSVAMVLPSVTRRWLRAPRRLASTAISLRPRNFSTAIKLNVAGAQSPVLAQQCIGIPMPPPGSDTIAPATVGFTVLAGAEPVPPLLAVLLPPPPVELPLLGFAAKAAVTDSADPSVTTHAPVPLHAPA